MAEVLLPVLGDWIKWSKIICYENKIFASNRKSEIKQQYYLQQNLDSNKTKNLMEKYKTTKKKREEKQAPYFKNLKSYLKRQYKDYNVRSACAVRNVLSHPAPLRVPHEEICWSFFFLFPSVFFFFKRKKKKEIPKSKAHPQFSCKLA